MGTDKTELGDRMKRYEEITNIKITPRMPIILRLDGVAFHTWTRTMEKPVDYRMTRAMTEAAKYLCERAQGACCAYVQSDEISILLVDYKKYTTTPWFDKKVQKLTSVSASIVASKFNEYMREVNEVKDRPLAAFDCRIIPIPREDVQNYFLWRQRDCIRNSIQSLAQANFPHRSLQGLKADDLIDKLQEEKGISWIDFPHEQKYGSWVDKTTQDKLKYDKESNEIIKVSTRSYWTVGTTPIFHTDEAEAIMDTFLNQDILYQKQMEREASENRFD